MFKNQQRSVFIKWWLRENVCSFFTVCSWSVDMAGKSCKQTDRGQRGHRGTRYCKFC